MARLKFLGGPNARHVHACMEFEVKIGEVTPEIPEEQAATLLRDYPGAWEHVAPETRKVDAPAHDRMRHKAAQTRSKT